MRRILLTVLLVLLVGVTPGPAQQHLVATPDALKWADPPAFPRAKMAIIQGDPGKEGLFMHRVKVLANYKIEQVQVDPVGFRGRVAFSMSSPQSHRNYLAPNREGLIIQRSLVQSQPRNH